MHGRKLPQLITTFVSLLAVSSVFASTSIEMKLASADGNGQSIGTIKAEDSFCGVLLTPKLHGLPAGVHGFHVHVNPSCADRANAAGGHLDPNNTNQHDGPYNRKGHLGDMPVLVVNEDGTATTPTLAPRFKLADLMKHALVIHAGGDNYADQPQKLGGGGARIACGVIGK